MRILLTGGAGFVGSNCLEYFLDNTDWHILVLDSFRHKGTYSRLSEINYDVNRISIFHHDLNAPIDSVLANRLGSIDYIINLASDSAVERSITDPAACWRNNCELILNVLEFARKVKPKLIFQLSSDEIFGEALDRPFSEWDTPNPSNVYSSSKSAQDMLSISYWRTYDLPIVLLTSMNLIASKQDPEKFLPKLIWKIATDQVMEIYGSENNIGSRFYLHVRNLANAMVFLSKLPVAMYKDGAIRPDRYNIVGDRELNNLQMAQLVAWHMNKELKYKLVPSESARKGYDRRYALCGDKMKRLGWRHIVDTDSAVKQIVDWTLKNSHWLYNS